MTPKEKAEELVGKFKRYVDFTDENDNTSLKAIISNSKQCALIAVDEIETALHKECYPNFQYEKTFEYWQEVKQEIEKL